MDRKRYAPGETVLSEGTASQLVGMIVDGSAEIVKQSGTETIVIGIAETGDYLGEMAALEGRPHGATVRAVSDLIIDVMPAANFLESAVQDADLAHRLLVRMSARLNLLNGAYADAVTGVDEAGLSSGPKPEPDPGLVLMPGSPYTARLLPAEGERLITSPVFIGRELLPGEPPPPMRVDIRFEDVEPFRLSRAHFSVSCEDDLVIVRDLGSHLGTQVNGRGIGNHFDTDFAILETGQNEIVAGGSGSPFVFKVVMGN